ncbi:benzoate 4-monooxygenase cytochrome P450 [Metarhizium album ARSEF 1941]|uniref:Benzoate 4-monooxygenase cytochrome P450 n=1 Tax=Metarhizium album (strain ARSEF 1941) TaxID=1081103 RepID=A0A0B2X579_METAS|nr:benzoate 4-monooxygenase cytochrome P450 [Metarhizium album ARSEF 1941]KHO00456.1 benzoate 4-monooxygenase cytochrome P450 [Metarhizium album ARSEF 1941]
MHILGARSQYTRSSWYNGLQFEPGKNNIISMRDDALHAVIRAKMAGGYSGKEVEYLEFKIDKSVGNLVSLLESYVRGNRPFDLARKIQYFALDVISELAFGEPFGDLTADSDVHNLVEDIETYLPHLIVSTVMSWMIPVLSLPIFRPLMPSEHDVLGVGRLVGIAKKVAAERYGPSRKIQRDMVGSFVARGLTQEQTENEIAAQMYVRRQNGWDSHGLLDRLTLLTRHPDCSIAGSDTTATGIRATFLHVMTNPRVLARLQAEIRDSELSWPAATDAEIRLMPFAQATIKEGLRVLPPVAGFMSKEVPADGDCWDGLSLPPGTRVGLCMMGILRQKHVFGEDADEFRPERWLDATPEMEKTWGLVFGSGKWACLGKEIARMELNKVLVEVGFPLPDSTFSPNCRPADAAALWTGPETLRPHLGRSHEALEHSTGVWETVTRKRQDKRAFSTFEEHSAAGYGVSPAALSAVVIAMRNMASVFPARAFEQMPKMILVAAVTLLSAMAPAASALSAIPFEGIPSLGVLYTEDASHHICSAAVVNSKTKNLILTAAHCVHGDGTHLRFAPGYRDGLTPYGTFPVTGAFVDKKWNKDSSVKHDFAILTVGNTIINGTSVPVQNITGGNPIKYRASHRSVVHVMSYNNHEPRPVRCHVSTYKGPHSNLAFNCRSFKGGSSGGPMLVDYNPNKKLGRIIGTIGGFQSGGCTEKTSYSPYFSFGLRRVFLKAMNETGTTTSGDVVRADVPNRC